MGDAKKVLIIEDDPVFLRTLEKILTSQGFEVQGFKQGNLDLDHIKQEDFPLALIGLSVEDELGLELLKKIRQNSPDTECIILTENVPPESAFQAASLGGLVYIQKQPHIEKILPIINCAMEKIESRKALARAKNRFQHLYENAFEGIVVMDIKGAITEFNAAFLKIVDYSAEELKQHNFSEFVSSECRERGEALMREAIQQGCTDASQEELTLKSGRRLPVEIVRFALCDNGDKPSEVWALIHAIGEETDVEKQLKRKLMEATVLRDVAAAGIASASVDELIARVAEIVGQLLDADYFGISRYDAERHWIYPHSSYHGSFPKEGNSADRGITGRAIRTGRYQLVDDVSADADYVCWRESTRSEITVPIKVDSGIFGVINVESDKGSHFSQQDVDLLTAIANQMAVAVQKINLQADKESRSRELSAIYETSLAITSILEPEALYEKLYQQLSGLFPLDAFILATYDPDDETIAFVYVMEEGKPMAELINKRFPKSEGGLIGWMIEKRKPIRLRNIHKEDLPVKSPQIGKPVCSWLGTPLVMKGKVVGAISVQCFREGVYSEQDQRLLESLAAQLAVALENAALVERSRNQIERLEALYDIDVMVSSSFDLRVTMNLLLDQVIEKLKVDAVALLLLNNENKTFEYAAGRGFRTHGIEKYTLQVGREISIQEAIERHLVQALDLADQSEGQTYLSLLQDEGFESFYSVPLIAKGEIKGLLDVFHRSLLLFDQDWLDFLEMIANRASIAIDNTMMLEELNRTNVELALAYDTTLEGWSKALDMRDRETEGHSQRAAKITVKIARKLGISEEEIVHIRRGALLHDIGKMGIPDSILLKPGPLDEEEWRIMSSHTKLAFDLLSPIAYLRPAMDIPVYHHERFDGSGYPQGLKGEEIPLAARIFAVVDVWDALTSDRPYRKAWTQKKALSYIKEQEGILFDPQVVEIFLELIQGELIS
ncbi:MAG: GAF domain-containing protein [Pelolinea sp.]|nr:GAF domain-containing protein [Pelolinea sp.]